MSGQDPGKVQMLPATQMSRMVKQRFYTNMVETEQGLLMRDH